MNSLLLIGSFMLGACSGAFCVFLQQRGIRHRLHKEITDQLDKALFDPTRRERQ
jgi:hypothetical protein